MSDIPQTMRAFRSVAAGEASMDVITVPTPGPRDVLIKVAAVDVNPADYKMFAMEGPAAMARPYVPGCDAAGTVVAVGAEVKDFQVGDEVFGMTGGLGIGPQGTLAEYAIGWEATLARKPAHLSMRQAAAIPLVLNTAWEGLMDRYTVIPHDVVLVTGASGGVGSVAVQLARAAGAAKVVGLASESKRDLVECFGAEFVDYRLEKEALVKKLRELTPEGAGFSVVFDAVGGSQFELALEVAAPAGYVTCINALGQHATDKATFKALRMSFPFACLHFLNSTPTLIQHYGGMLRAALPLVESGAVTAPVDESRQFGFTKEDILGAFEYLEKGQNRGKVVVNIQPS